MIPNTFRRVCSLFLPRTRTRNRERYLFLSRSFLMRRNSVLSGFRFSLFTNIHHWTEAKHNCKLIRAATESLDAKDPYNWLSSAWTWWGIACPEITWLSAEALRVKRRGPETGLGDSKREIKLGGQTITQLYHLTSASQVRFKPIKVPSQ